MKGREWIDARVAGLGAYRTHIIVLALFTVLTIILTYPEFLSMPSALPGKEDIPQMVWYFWMTGQALSGIGTHSSIFHTNYIFYPDGIQMVPFSMAYDQILALAMIPVLGPALTCNILYLSAFILSGFGAYLLARHVTHNDAASAVAGIVYTFAPYHFAHAYAGHIGSVTMQWIPFCILFLMKAFEGKKIADAIIAAAFFVLVAMSDLQYMVFAGLLILLYPLYGIITGSLSLDRKTLTILAVFGTVAFIGILPFTYSMIATTFSNNNTLAPDPGEARFYSADLLSFFIPSKFHTLFGGLVSGLFYNKIPAGSATPWEVTAYAGVTVLLLSLYASLKEKSREFRFWLISALFFALMCLGPVLHVYGRSTFFNSSLELPMPYALLSMIVPGLGNSRTPGRFDVIVVLCLAMLAAYAMSMVMKRIGQSRARGKNALMALAPVAISCLILFEYLSVPFAMTSPEVPSFYHGLANETGDFAIMEIPATAVYLAGVDTQYYQTVHHKPMVGGQAARVPGGARDFEANTPLVRQLTYLTNDTGDALDQNVTDIGASVLQFYGIRYVIVHRNYLSDEQLRTVTGYLNASPGLEAAGYDDGNMIVYRVANVTMKPFMARQGGWWDAETSNGSDIAWTKENATLLAYSPSGGGYRLAFNVSGFRDDRPLQVYVNGEKVYENRISPSFTAIGFPVQLNEGNNTIAFTSPEGSVRPADIPGLGSMDTRNISFAFQDIRISPG